MGKLYLICGDYISNSNDMDAIVNSANKYMINGSGICGAIYNACGNELLEYCQNNFHNYMVNGEVRITSGFKLKSDIIHILAPKYFEEKDPIDALMNCYGNLLQVIKNKGYKKVLLPSLGTGVHGYNHKDIVKPLINLLNGFCKINDVELYFNNYHPIYKDIYLKYFLETHRLNLKKDLVNKEITDIKKYLENNNLLELNVNDKYKNYIKGKELEELCLTDKLICLQYTIYNFKIEKENLKILIDSL